MKWLSFFRRKAPPAPSATGIAPERRERRASESLEAFQADFGIRFRDPSVLAQALTHRSYLSGDGDPAASSNERMEFLGDSVLELIVNEHLYRHHPEYREGDLTKMKSLLVSRTILARVAREMNLGRYIHLSESEDDSGGRQRPSILADAFEAVIGAIYLDRGIGEAKRFTEERLLKGKTDILSDQKLVNYKSALQEHVQSRFKTHPRYRTLAEMGPDHAKIFKVEVSVRGRVLGVGEGKNKKRAEQAAARDALAKLEAP